MKILNSFSVLFSLIVIFSTAWYFRNDIKRRLDDFAIKSAQDKFGTMSLAQCQEEKIRNIAQEMNITEHFIIRKMNRAALLAYGYCNAFVCFYTFLNFIPINNTPFLFVSEGFFEDLSEEEQRFLIGHELIHLQEHHTQYFNLILYCIWIMMLIFCRRFRNTIFSSIQWCVPIRYSSYVSYVSMSVFCCVLFLCSFISTLGSLAYRRNIEWIADCRSLELLKSYDGAIKITERWQKEFKIPLHNPYFGLFSGHPSCHERIVYYEQVKNKAKESL